MENKLSIEELLECSFVLLDKPVGPSSHEVTTQVKKMFGARRTGHAGTLDPQVSGVLVVALNRASRLIRFITSKDKTYVGVLRLRRAPDDIGQLQAAMRRQVGAIMQMPPKMSAVAKRIRQRKVFEFTALELEKNTALFVSKVEAGTYIRVLCQEAGKQFGGGKMIQLRRTAVGRINESHLVTLPQLADALWMWKEKGDEKLLREMLVPATELIDLPRIWLNEEGMKLFSRGAPLTGAAIARADGGIMPGQTALLLSSDGRLMGVGKTQAAYGAKTAGTPAAWVRAQVVLAKPRD
ncbi:MAG: RNA-guided pseudouridylation complex pseudouridine synthase subunit Cbf5 [Candidatus Micrarchaeota archaeon]|nr:RNA-guided pseudouridylation complex pseudouridine synthase subunit Cbf5 [Candidatus Micrarchaeota archaeon]